VYELREMGLDVQVFDPQKPVVTNPGDENPILLVTTVAMARGLDLPDATHVFSLGIPDGSRVAGRTVDAYTHVSGRVGRFGRPGTVITVVEAGQGELMRRILRELGVAPVRFRQFE
jgi:superfamily II DNA/RNA helicase